MEADDGLSGAGVGRPGLHVMGPVPVKRCSFCGAAEHNVERLVTGVCAAICDRCLAQAALLYGPETGVRTAARALVEKLDELTPRSMAGVPTAAPWEAELAALRKVLGDE